MSQKIISYQVNLKKTTFFLATANLSRKIFWDKYFYTQVLRG